MWIFQLPVQGDINTEHDHSGETAVLQATTGGDSESSSLTTSACHQN